MNSSKAGAQDGGSSTAHFEESTGQRGTSDTVAASSKFHARSNSIIASIGVPVYNGEKFLRRSLDALLAQSLANFELIISDNASTDNTASICAEYASDPRIRYFRQPQNVGVSRNWNFVADQARAPFFKWASANDTCDPSMLERCIDVLTADERVVLCFGRTRLINENDDEIEVYDGDFSVIDERPSARFRQLRRQLALNNAQSAVIRTDALRRTGMVRLYPGGDMVLMAELALLGHYRLLPDVLLNRRIAPGTFSSLLSREQLKNFWDPQRSKERELDRVLLHKDHIAAVLRLARPWRETAAALESALRYIYWDHVAIRRELGEWLRSSLAR